MSIFPFPKWLAKLLSYISAFTLGIYTYASTHGNVIEPHRWLLTSVFGLMFFLFSLSDKK